MDGETITELGNNGRNGQGELVQKHSDFLFSVFIVAFFLCSSLLIQQIDISANLLQAFWDP
jgi:hypothetical protein